MVRTDEIVLNWMQFISRKSDISYVLVGIWYGGAWSCVTFCDAKYNLQ